MLHQLVYDNLRPVRGRLKRVRSDLAQHLSKFILKRGDPIVLSTIMGQAMQMPFSHALPLILRLHPLYAKNLARIGRYTQQKYPDLTCVDIGANIGDTIAVLRSEAQFPILCVEGDAFYFSVLENNAARFADVDIVRAFVGETAQDTHIEVVKNSGTAHIKLSHTEEPGVQIKPLWEVLNEKPVFHNAKLLKVDTDGFDGKILRGSADFLQRAKPIIFFEYDPFFLAGQGDDGLSLFDFFTELGYDKVIVYDNFGEMLLTSQVSCRALLEELHLYMTGKRGEFYYDLCAFHAEDDDLFHEARKQEMAFHQQWKERK